MVRQCIAWIVVVAVAGACSKTDGDAKSAGEEAEGEAAEAPVAADDDDEATPAEPPDTPDEPQLEGELLREGVAVRRSWDESPDTSFVWPAAGGETIGVELVPPPATEGNGSLFVTAKGTRRELTTFVFDVARGGSGFELTLLPTGQLEVVLTYGSAGADPGEVVAHLLAWNDATDEVAIEKTWTGDDTQERPAWEKVGSERTP